MNFHALYAILSTIARRQKQIYYSELSTTYHAACGEWVEPHGGWDYPLGELNQMLERLNWPALSAVVVLKETNEPGGGFWGSSDSVPQRPRDGVERSSVYAGILKGVYGVVWPHELPSASPA